MMHTFKTENGPRWFGHLMRRKETDAVRLVVKMNVERGRRKPKKNSWIRLSDMKAAGVRIDVEDR